MAPPALLLRSPMTLSAIRIPRDTLAAMENEPNIDASADDAVSRDRDDADTRWPPDSASAIEQFMKVGGGTDAGIRLRQVLVVLFPVAFILIAARAPLTTPLWDRGVAWVALAVLVIFEILGIRELVLARGRRALGERLASNAATHGHMRWCPACGGDPFGDAPCCRRYPKGWTRMDLHAFWHEMASIGVSRVDAADRPRGPYSTSPGTPSGGGRFRAAQLRRQVRRLLVVMACVLAIIGLHEVTDGGGLPMILELAIIVMPILWAAKALEGFLRTLFRGYPASTPSAPRCGKCGQELRTPYPERCTECGTTLKAWNSVTFGPEALGN